MGKQMKAQLAAAAIPDEACIWLVAGGGGINEPNYFLKELERYFMRT